MDDDPEFLQEAKISLEMEEPLLRVDTVDSAEKSLEMIKQNPYHAIVSDFEMTGMNGLDLLKTLRKQEINIPFILFTDGGEGEDILGALTLGANRFLQKGDPPDIPYTTLTHVIVQEVEHYQEAKRVKSLLSLLNAIRKVNQRINRASSLKDLLQEASELLLEIKGCVDVSMAFLDERGKIEPVVHSGALKQKKWRIRPDGVGKAPTCVKEVIASKSVKVIESTKDYCDDCEHARCPSQYMLVEVPILRRDVVMGVLLLHFVRSHKLSSVQLDLLQQIAKDLGFARTKFKANKARALGVAQAKLQAEKTILKKEERFRKLFEGSPDAILLMNSEGIITEVNERACQISGYEREELVGSYFLDLLGSTEESKEKLEKHFKRRRKNKEPVPSSYTIDFKRKDGVKRYLEIKAAPLKEHGIFAGIIGIARDITQRKKAEEKLEVLYTWAQLLNKAETMDEVFKHTLDAIEQIFTFQCATVALKKGNQLTVEKYRGPTSLRPKEKLPLDGESSLVGVAKKGRSLLIKDRTSTEYPLPFPIKSEVTVPIQIESKILGVLDVKSRERNTFDEREKRLLEQLVSHIAVAIRKIIEKEQRVSLQRLDELRNRFIAMTAHEFGTPLTSIKADLEMLSRGYYGELSQEQEEKIKRTLESVGQLNRLIKDFRQITKLRTEKISLERRDHRLVDTVEKALERFSGVFPQEGIMVKKHIPQPLSAEFDEDRIVQVIQNIVKNAIDFTEDTIWIKGGETTDTVWLSVEDNGVGIPEEEQDKIFEPFYGKKQKQSQKKRCFGGSGLGLYVCKRIVNAHKGELWVDSSLGEGATFTITLPKRME